MNAPAAHPRLYGLLAEFDTPDRLREAVQSAQSAGYHHIDAFSPFPVEGLAREMGFKEARVPLLVLLGAFVGAASGFGIQVWANLDFPLNDGGRPVIAIPAFMLITFELLVLGAVLFGVFGMLILNRLPRLHHPVFEVPTFRLASIDGFFLLVRATDERFEPAKVRRFLSKLKPVRIDPVPITETDR